PPPAPRAPRPRPLVSAPALPRFDRLDQPLDRGERLLVGGLQALDVLERSPPRGFILAAPGDGRGDAGGSGRADLRGCAQMCSERRMGDAEVACHRTPAFAGRGPPPRLRELRRGEPAR